MSYYLCALTNFSPSRYKANTVEPTEIAEILLKSFTKSVYEQHSFELRFKVYSTHWRSRQIVWRRRPAFAFVWRVLFFLFYRRFHNSRRTRNVIDGTNRSHGINPKWIVFSHDGAAELKKRKNKNRNAVGTSRAAATSVQRFQFKTKNILGTSFFVRIGMGEFYNLKLIYKRFSSVPMIRYVVTRNLIRRTPAPDWNNNTNENGARERRTVVIKFIYVIEQFQCRIDVLYIRCENPERSNCVLKRSWYVVCK